jgi:tRNA dimethylallyltransferase
MNKHLISIVGPTAIGKTDLSIKLAQYFKTEIISADSRQFYKEMQIGTAAPTAKELSQANHHFVHHISIKENYNVGSFEKNAIQCLTELYNYHDIVVMVGGSGLYVNAVTKGLDEFPEIDPGIRKLLNERLTNDGLIALQNELKLRDLQSFNTIAINNPHRVIRALEVCIGTNKPYSSFLKKVEANRDFNVLTIGLDAERSVIYERINKRVEKMMKKGLLEEVKTLVPSKHLNALNTVGYKELFSYLSGEHALEFAISEIKKNSRRFAKRQLTWFKKDPDTLWFDHSSSLQEIISTIEKKLSLK